MIFSLSIFYLQGDKIMKNKISEENVLRSAGGNWYTYFYDETYGWSWSTAYINNLEREKGKQLTIRVNPDSEDKWQGCYYKGSKTFNNINRKSYGIEIYTPLHAKIKTYDTVKIDVNGNIIIGGDTVLNILGDVIQAGNGEYMIGRYDTVKDGRGNIVSDEVIKAETEAYGSSVDFDCDSVRYAEYKKRRQEPERLAVLAGWPWKIYDNDSKTFHIKDGTKVIAQSRTLVSNVDRILNGETTSAGYIRFDKIGAIHLSNGIIINAPKNTIVSVEYETGECTVTICDSEATITKPDGAEVTVSSGTIIDNEGNIIK
jgi:hypothetical protein